MTQQDDITRPVLTDDEIQELWDEACKDSPQAPGWYRHICFARALLSKLRAPVADERAALEWYAEHVAGCRKLGPDGDAARQALDKDGGERAHAALASAPVADEKPDESNSPVPLTGHSMGPMTPIYDHVGSLIGQALATARHGAYEGSIVWTRMRHAGEWMPWHVAGKQSAPVAGEAIYYAVMHGNALYGIFGTEAAAEACKAQGHPDAPFSVKPLYAAPQASAEPVQEVAGVTLDGCLETLFRVGEHLGINYAESRKQPGAPSGVYIKAIEDRISQASNAAREEAAKLMDQTSRSSGAELIRALKTQADKDGGQQRASLPAQPGAQK